MDENQKPLQVREHLQAYGFDRQDRDLLIRLNTRVEDLITSLEKKDNILAQDIGGLKEGKLDKSIYAAHCKEDEKEFESLWKKSDEHGGDVKALYKYLWLGMGALAVIQFISPFLISRYL